MKDNYIIIGGELYHFGVPGMRWGKRRAQAKKEYEADLDKRKKEYKDEADKIYNQTKEYKDKEKWLKKHPGKTERDYWNSDDFNPDDYYDEDQPLWDASDRARGHANRLDKNYAKYQAQGSALVSSMLLSPVAMFAAAKLSKGKIKNGKARAALVLGTGLANTALWSLYGYASGKREHNRAVKAEGIKTVRERMKESKNK